MKTALWWIRRDLRLTDNAALQTALREAEQVIPVYILDPALMKHQAQNREAFLLDGLHALADDLLRRGSCLIVRTGSPDEELANLVQETGAESIFAEEDYSPYALKRDARISKFLPLNRIVGTVVFHPEMVKKQDGNPYTVFTPYRKAWKTLPFPAGHVAAAPDHFSLKPGLNSVVLPDFKALADFPAGEKEAQKRLADFLENGIGSYQEGRNILALDGTSRLSPYLRFGMISARQAAFLALQSAQSALTADSRRGAETWLNELIWREFYVSILYQFPDVLQQAFRPQMRSIAWRQSEKDLTAWQQGRTGFPIVDACMRQLLQTGWMHNRGRMIAASFLVKDLLIDWRQGEHWFMQRLVDGDPAANNGGWQWTAGVGTDAAPYFRIFNPVLQGKKFDPQGLFVKRWVPELQQVPAQFIHDPWKMPLELQRQFGCVLGSDYPAPIVDHSAARERTLAAYRSAKMESSF